MISSVSPRQNVIFTNGYFFMKACGERTLRLIDDGRGVEDDPALLAGAVEDHLLAVGGAAGEDVLRAGGRGHQGSEHGRRQQQRSAGERTARRQPYGIVNSFTLPMRRRSIAPAASTCYFAISRNRAASAGGAL